MLKKLMQLFKSNIDELINKLKIVFLKNNLILAGIFIVVGLILHLELVIREVGNPDTINGGYFFVAESWEVSLGRWFLVILSTIKFGLSTPLFSTFFSILLMVISALFIIDLFNVKSSKIKSIITLFLLLMPAFSRVLTYHYCSIEYTFSMLLAVLVVWCFFKIGKKFIGIILSSIALAISMGIYQSYIGVAFSLYLIYIIHKLFISEKNTYKLLDIIKDIFRFLIVLFLGFLLYALCAKIALKYFQVLPASFRGANNISISNSIKNFPQSLYKSYQYFNNLFFTDKLLKNSFYHREILNGVILSLIIFIIFFKNIKEKKYKELIFQLLILALLPIACNAILFIATETYMSIIMVHGMFMLFILFIILFDEIKIKFIKFIVSGLFLILLLTYIIAINASYAAWSLTENQTLSVAQRILVKIEGIESYTENSEICIVGAISDKNFPKTNPIYNMTIEKSSSSALFWNNSQYDFVRKQWSIIYNRYFGYKIKFCSIEEYEEIISSDEFEDMPVFPNNGYVKDINGIITVKLEK